MPSMADIVVADAVPANHTFSAVNGSAGDKTPAVWRDNAAHTIVGYRPRFSVVMRDNANSTGRIFTMAFNAPIAAEDANGNWFLAARFPLQVTGVIPTNVEASVINNLFYQAGNLIVSSLVRACVNEAAPPTGS
jgi:hypothetical protein